MNKGPSIKNCIFQKLEFAVCQARLGLVGAQGENAGRAWVVLAGKCDNTKIYKSVVLNNYKTYAQSMYVSTNYLLVFW